MHNAALHMDSTVFRASSRDVTVSKLTPGNDVAATSIYRLYAVQFLLSDQSTLGKLGRFDIPLSAMSSPFDVTSTLRVVHTGK